MGSNIELNVDDFSDDRHYKNREERSFLVSQNSGLKKRKSLDHSEGTLANPSQNISSSVPKSQLEEDRPLTNDQILEFIEKEVALLKSVPRKKDDMEWQRGPGVSLPEKTENYPGIMSSCSPSQEECNRVKETPDTLSLLCKHVRQEREDISLKPVEVVGFDRVPGMIDGNRDANANAQTNIEDQQYCHVGSKEPPERFCLNSYTEKIGIKNMQLVTINQSDQSVCSQTSSKNMEDTTAMCLQANLSISLAVNKDGKIIPSCRPEGEDTFFVSVLNGPRCDGIPGAEDLPRLGMNLLNTKQEEEKFADPVYEDISEDESPQFQNTAEEMDSLPCDVPEDNAMLYERVQNQAKMNPGLIQERIPKEYMSPKTETCDLAQHCSCPCFVESDDGFEDVLCPKCDSEKRLKWQASRSFRLLSVTQHQEETEEAAEEEPSAKSKEKCGLSTSEKDLTGAEDSPRLGMNLLNTKQEEEEFANPVYEDISEDESPQFQNTAEEMDSLPCDVPEDNAMLYERVQNQAKMNPGLNQELIPKEQISETCGLAQHCSCPCFVESDDGFEDVLCPKCDSEKHFRPFSVTHQEETEEAAEDDSEWLVIPINVEDVKWEAPGEDQVDGENISHCDSEHENQVKQSGTYAAVCEVPKSAPNQVPAAAFSPMEVFDTPTQQAKAMQSKESAPQSSLVPSSCSTAETKAHQPQNGESHYDSEDSCETEDSSDYSSDSERNYLTVSTQFLNNLSVPASPETHDCDSDSEKENEDHEMANLQQCQTTGRSKSSGTDDIINLDSDTEDEDFQNFTETKTKRLFSTHTQNQVKKHSPEPAEVQCGTVKENLQTNGLQSTESPASQSQPRCHKEVIQTRNAPLSQRTEKSGHLLENKIASHLTKESYAQNISEDPSVIVIYDSDDEGKQSNRQVKRKGMLTSESMSRGTTSCDEQRGDSEKKESAKPKDGDSGVPSADSSKSEHQSKLQHMQLKEKRLDARLSHSIKKRKLIKVRVHPEHFHQKPNRQIKSKTIERDIAKNLKSKTNVVLSETEDSDDALVDAQSSLSDRKNPQISLSSKDSSKMLSQSADRDVDSTKAHREHFQQKAKKKTASKKVEREMEKDLNKQKRTTRVLSSETEDSDDTLLYPQTSPPSMDYPQKLSVDSATDSIKVRHKYVQQKTNGHMTSKTMGRELEKDLIKHKRKTGILPSEMEHSDDTLIYAQTSLSSADMPEKHPQTVDCDDDSTVAPNPVIPRFLVKKFSQSRDHLKLVEQSTVQKRGKNESQATPKTPAETSKKTDFSKKETEHFSKGIKGKAVYKPNMSKAQRTAPLPRSVDSSSSSRHHSPLSRLQRSDSNSKSSTTGIPTKGPSSSTSMQSSAKKQVFHDWEKSFVPTRRDRKKSLESKLRTRNNCDSLRDARPGPSHHNKVRRRRRRRSSCESVPPLMKRPKYEAMQMTKSRKRDTPRERFPVSQDYKLKK